MSQLAASKEKGLSIIDGQRVTPDNPPRPDVDGMDHAWGAALHN